MIHSPEFVYLDILCAAARDYFDRGITVVPINYINGEVRPFRGFLDWAKSKPTLEETIQLITAHSADAIAAVASTTSLVWLDIDDRRDLPKFSRNSKLPTCKTFRGEHRIFRTSVQINGTFHLKKLGLNAELRCGDVLTILPPSRSRRNPRSTYWWRTPLPYLMEEIPIIDPVSLIHPSQETLRQQLKAELNARSRRLYASESTLNRKTIFESEHSYGFTAGAPIDVANYMPSMKGERLQMLPLLMHDMMRQKPEWSDTEIARIANDWFVEAKKRDVTKAVNPESTASALRRLRDTFNPKVSPLIENAIDRFRKMTPVDVSLIAGRKASGRHALSKIASLCSAISFESNGQPFFLSCRYAGKITGISHTAAWSALRRLVSFQWLHVIDGGTPGVKVDGKAATFQWCYVPQTTSNPPPIVID